MHLEWDHFSDVTLTLTLNPNRNPNCNLNPNPNRNHNSIQNALVYISFCVAWKKSENRGGFIDG